MKSCIFTRMKKLFISMLTVGTVVSLGGSFASSVPVYAAESITATPTIIDVQINGKQGSGELSDVMQGYDENLIQAINDLNGGGKLSDLIDNYLIEFPSDFKGELSDYSLLTKIQDLKIKDENGNDYDGAVTITMEVTNLTDENTLDVQIMHYSNKRERWEVVTPENINYNDHTIKFSLEDTSPIGVVYDKEESTKKVEETKQDTEQSNVLSWLFAGLIGTAVIVLIIRVKQRK